MLILAEGNILFVPFFLTGIGALIALLTFWKTIVGETTLVVALACLYFIRIPLGLIIIKFVAAWRTKIICKYSWAETLTMRSRPLPQVVATLAAAPVGLEVGLLNGALFNNIIVLMLITSILGPVLNQRYGALLKP